MAKDVGESGFRPYAAAECHEPVFGHVFPLASSDCVGEEGGGFGQGLVDVEVVTYGGIWTEDVVASRDDDRGTFLASCFGPRYAEGR